MSEVLLTNRHFSDLNPLFFGREECRSGHSFGPAIVAVAMIFGLFLKNIVCISPS